jgi:hypothetical protein
MKNDQILCSFVLGFERSVIMIVFRKKGETELSVPNWVAALVLSVAILALAMLLVKYLPDIILWLR